MTLTSGLRPPASGLPPPASRLPPPAYPTGFKKTRAGTLSAHPVYGCRLGKNGRGESNGKATEMSADPHDR